MAYPPGMELHGSSWRIVKRVPKDLLPFYKKSLLRLNTGIADRKAAATVAWRWLADLDAEFARLRAQVVPLTSLTESQIDAVKTSASRGLLLRDELLRRDPAAAEVLRLVVANRRSGEAESNEAGVLSVALSLEPELGLDDAQADFLAERNQELRDYFRRALARGNIKAIQPYAADAARQVGIVIDWSSSAGQALLRQLLPVFARAGDALAGRDSGDVVATPAQPVVVFGHHRLTDAVPIWKAYRTPAIATVEIYAATAKLFGDYFPDQYVETLTSEHIRAFVERRMEEGKSPKTIEKEHGALRSLLAFAVQQGWRRATGDDNPASNTTLPKDRVTRKRRSMTLDELTNLFAAPVFTQGERMAAGKGEAAFWIPLLALFTGARREELAQLTPDRVRDFEGVPYFAVDPIDDSGSLKTTESRRAVPLHRELIRLGFLDYVADCREQGATQLFPMLKPNARGQYGAKWGDWWSRYFRKYSGVEDPRVAPMHSFRHGFISELRRLQVREDDERMLVGHTLKMERRDAHDGYGEHFVPSLSKVVNQVDFRGLDLASVRPYRSGMPREP